MDGLPGCGERSQVGCGLRPVAGSNSGAEMKTEHGAQP